MVLYFVSIVLNIKVYFFDIKKIDYYFVCLWIYNVYEFEVVFLI